MVGFSVGTNGALLTAPLSDEHFTLPGRRGTLEADAALRTKSNSWFLIISPNQKPDLRRATQRSYSSRQKRSLDELFYDIYIVRYNSLTCSIVGLQM